MTKTNIGSRKWVFGTTTPPHDRIKIRYATYNNDQTPTHWLVFVNGRTEWIEKYSHLPDELMLPPSCGFLTWDHRGQGASEGRRSYVAQYRDYSRDAKHIIEMIAGDTPFSIMAHSMGGLISLYATLLKDIAPEGMVLCSPLLRLPNQPVPRLLSRPIANLFHALGVGHLATGAGKHDRRAFKRNRLTHSYDAYLRIKDSPYRCGSATYGWLRATYAATSLVFENEFLSNLKAPTLVIGGSRETVVDERGFTDWVQRASSAAPTTINFLRIHGAKHELFSEIDDYRLQAVSSVRDWLMPLWASKLPY